MLVRVLQPQWGLRIIILNKLPVMLVLLNCKPHFEAKLWIAECSGNVFFIIPETTCIWNIVGGVYSARPGEALLSAFLSLSLIEHLQCPTYCVVHITHVIPLNSLFFSSRLLHGLFTQFLVTFAQNVTFPMRTYPTTLFQVKKVKVLIAQSCLILCDTMGCSLPGSSVHGIIQARILE